MNAAALRKEFIKEMDKLCRKWDRWTVWSDWLLLASSALYNSVHRDPEVEAEYMQTVRKYDADEAIFMSRLLGIVTQGLDVQIHDFLGMVFHEMELHNKNIGQFFTPYSLCRMMAAMVKAPPPRPGRLLKIGEPACGSGAMVLAYHEAMMEAGAEQCRLMYYLKDLDHRAFRMAYIQLSLCGIAAEVELGDTLRMTTTRVWRTIGYYLHDIPTRLRVDRMMQAISGDENAPDDHGQRGTVRQDSVIHVCNDAGLSDSVDEVSCAESQPTYHEAQQIEEEPEATAQAIPVVPDLILPRPGEHFDLFAGL